MDESVYKVIYLVGTSTKSWEDVVNNVVVKASESLRIYNTLLRIALKLPTYLLQREICIRSDGINTVRKR